MQGLEGGSYQMAKIAAIPIHQAADDMAALRGK